MLFCRAVAWSYCVTVFSSFRSLLATYFQSIPLLTFPPLLFSVSISPTFAIQFFSSFLYHFSIYLYFHTLSNPRYRPHLRCLVLYIPFMHSSALFSVEPSLYVFVLQLSVCLSLLMLLYVSAFSEHLQYSVTAPLCFGALIFHAFTTP